MKKKLVVLTGAGISAESGISTFRDQDGLWEQYDISDVATLKGWYKNRELVLDFYNKRRADCRNVYPNAAHIGLAKLEEYFDVQIITQNIDDLHERGGSTNVLHLHGEINKACCESNIKDIYEVENDIKLGDLSKNGKQLRPFVVWFGEDVPLIPRASMIVSEADIFVVIGTSLEVYPAGGLVNYAPDRIIKYVIDKKIPVINHVNNLHRIEKSATEGIVELTELLKQYHEEVT